MYILTKIKSFLLFVVVIFALTSCVTSRKVNYLQDGKHIAQYADSVEYVDYTVKAGDILYVYVNSLDKESQNLFNGGISQNNSTYANNPLYSYNIYEDGTIDFPALGKIYVAEKSVREIKFLLQEKLKDFMTHFSVEVRLQNRTFSVIGETGTGRYSMPKEKINIFQALAMCGDLSNFSDRGKIQLIRQVGEETKVFEIDVRSKTIINSEYYYIQPNDVIYIPFLREKAFGITHVTSVLSTTLSTFSFVMTLVNIGVLISNNVKQKQNESGK